jgi:hypothetical protein
MVLATTTAVLGACSLFLLSGLRRENVHTAPDSYASLTSHAEERAAEAPASIEHAAIDAAPAPYPGPGWLHGSLPDPSGLPMLTADSNLRVRQRYDELFREMGLSEHQIDALIPVLIAQEQRESEPRNSGELGAAPHADHERAAIRAVLGPDNGARFLRLSKTLPARMQLNSARAQLEETDVPLREEQRKQLLGIMSAQEPLPPWERIRGESSDQQFARYRRWQQERDERFLKQAAPVLTPAQTKHLATQATMHAAVVPLRTSDLGAAGASAPR